MEIVWGRELTLGASGETEQLVDHDPTAQGPSMENRLDVACRISGVHLEKFPPTGSKRPKFDLLAGIGE